MTKLVAPVVGLSADALFDLSHFETVRARMGDEVFGPALKEVLRQLWKLVRADQGAEDLGAVRLRVKQVLVISDRFGMRAVNRRAQAIMRATANFPRDGSMPAEAEPLWERLRTALWETQALVESGSLTERTCEAA